MKQLRQNESDRAAHILQNDADVIDWMPASEDKLLMQRQYVPDVGVTGHLVSRTKDGLGVDRLDTDHQLDDSDARVAMLIKAGELLDRTIAH